MCSHGSLSVQSAEKVKFVYDDMYIKSHTFIFIKILQAYDLQFDPDDSEELEKTIARDVLNCELTKTEFAEFLSMNPNSTFVNSMFDLVDKDKSGSMSFREFMDIIVIFAKGKVRCSFFQKGVPTWF